MAKKLVKHGNSLAVVIDKPILSMLNFDEKTVVELVVEDGQLIIRPKTDRKNKDSKELEQLVNKLIDKYDTVLRKLSKT